MRGLRAEVVCVALGLLTFGALSALVVPPCQVPDEGYAFLRAYHVSDGYFLPELVDEWGGGAFPPAVVRIVETAAPLIGRPERKFTRDDWKTLANLDWSGEPRP